MSKIPEITSIQFNQDNSFFICTTQDGFRIFSSELFVQIKEWEDPYKQVYEKTSIGYGEMLYRSNIIALIGGGRNPRFPSTQIALFDDYKKAVVGELNFLQSVKSVKMSKDVIIAVLKNVIYIYDFKSIQLLKTIETFANPLGLFALLHSFQIKLMVFPGLQKGQIRVDVDDNKTMIINAHKSNLAHLSLNSDGSLLATASEKGTTIFVYSCLDGNLLYNFYRGYDNAKIWSISFSNQYVAVSSDKPTVHIFKLEKSYLPIRSFLQITVQDLKSMVSFTDQETLVIVGYDGHGFTYKIPSKKLELSKQFMQPKYEFSR